MDYVHNNQTVTDEDRREFLKVLGVTGVAAAGGVALSDVREGLSTTETTETFASFGEALRADMAGAMDAAALAEHQAAFAEAASDLPAVIERGLPENGPREEFGAVAEAGWPLYEHLTETGFFERSTEHLPTFTPQSLTESTEIAVGSEAIASSLEGFGVSEEAAVDLVVPTVNQAEKLSYFHWIASEGIPQGHEVEGVLPPITQRVTGGILLWLQNLDGHLYRNQILIGEDILRKGVWHVQGMTTGFYLLSEAATAIAEGSDRFSAEELGAAVATGIALQEVGQRLLPEDVHWISESARDPGNREITVKSLST